MSDKHERDRIEHVISCMALVFMAKKYDKEWIDSWFKLWMPWIKTLALEYPDAKVSWIIEQVNHLDAALARWFVENQNAD